MALVVLGDNNQDEYDSLKPYVKTFLDAGMQVRLLLVPLSIRSTRGSSDPGWLAWAQDQGCAAVVFLSLVPGVESRRNNQDAPAPLPKLVIDIARSAPTEKLAQLETFLSPWTDKPARRPGKLECTVIRGLPRGAAQPLADCQFTLHGGLEVLDRIPFLKEYLDLDEPSNLHTPRIETGKLRAQLFERDMTIKRLQRNEKRYRKYFEDDITGDFLMDLDWRVLDCNRAFSRIFGFPSVDYALGYDLRLLFPSEDERQKVASQFSRLHALDYYELELVRPDGQPVHIIANILGIRNETSELTQVRGFLFDNTPRKNLEKQLRESQKMEGLGRLAGGIAHDFNNLLTVINGYAELLISDMSMDEGPTEELGQILQAGLKASDLTRQLLAFSRQQVLTPQILNLNDVVYRMETMLQRLMTERIHLKFVRSQKGLYLRADKGQLEQVVLNLVLNARDAMPQGGVLSVATKEMVIDASVYDAGDFILPGRYVCLEVSDTGVGMDEEVRKRIFEPFFTTKPQGKGTGLGLAMVYGIVQQSGGTLLVESAPGQGSQFSILFESLQKETTPLFQGDAGTPVQPASHERIILVEDEANVRDFVTRILVRAGYTVRAFSDGSEALSFLARREQLWDLVVTDIIMPIVTGPELFQKLQGSGIDIPFLYMSGYTDDEIIRHGVQTRQMEFIHKPFKSRELLAKVKQVLETR